MRSRRSCHESWISRSSLQIIKARSRERPLQREPACQDRCQGHRDNKKASRGVGTMNRSATRPGLVRFVECLVLIVGLVIPASAWAEVDQFRISRGFGAAYLPLYVMDAQGLVQKHAAAAGLGDVKVE